MNSTNQEMESKKNMEASEEKIGELKELVSKVIATPKSMIAIIELKEFMSNLSYGCVPDKVLVDAADSVSKVNRVVGFEILRYSVNQACAKK
ncbi:MAG: hypothetical protein IJO70_00750 [Lachnospiraceae bacterium]|nr:hypothetical protein [Lachnospiraceae bacterium]